MKTYTRLLSALVGVMLLSCSLSEPELPAETDKMFILSVSDLTKLCDSAAGIALVRSQNPVVRQYAGNAASASNSMSRELTAVAWQKRVQMRELSASNATRIDSLEVLSGDRFDVAFLDMAIDAHQQMLSLYESQAQYGTDMGIRTWAKDKLPAIRERLDEAQRALKRL